MYPRGLFGQFYQVKSLMHKINSSVKLIGCFIMLIIILFTMSVDIHIMLSVLLILMILLTKIPLKYFFKILYSLRYILVIVSIILAALSFSLKDVLIYFTKIIILVEYVALIAYTSSTSELSYGIEKVLTPFNLFNLKLGKISYFITTIIKFYPLFVNNVYILLKSQSARGIDYGFSNLYRRIKALTHAIYNGLLKTFKEIKEIKLECDIRLFNISNKRTNINYNKIGFYDIALIFFHLLILLSYVIELETF